MPKEKAGMHSLHSQPAADHVPGKNGKSDGGHLEVGAVDSPPTFESLSERPTASMEAAAKIWAELSSSAGNAAPAVVVGDAWPEAPTHAFATSKDSSARSPRAADDPTGIVSGPAVVGDSFVYPKQSPTVTLHKPSFDAAEPFETRTGPEALVPSSFIASTSTHVLPPALLAVSRDLFRGSDGNIYFQDATKLNATAIRLTMQKALALLKPVFARSGIAKKQSIKDLKDDVEALWAWVEENGQVRPVWYRVAKIDGGIEIDLGDADHTRVRITDAGVEIVTSDSKAWFYRTKHSKPLVRPADTGDLELLRKFVNLPDPEFKLFIAWLAYTLASPKVETTNYVILVLQGGQGSGKSWLCKYVVLRLIDPSLLGVQRMPKTEGDLAIATQDSHVVCYDNVRGFSSDVSDLLCIAATGGQVAKRQLYTDSSLHVLKLHGAIVLNGIHTFGGQSDLAQRCLPLNLRPLPESKRQSESAMQQELEAALPAIQRGLFDLIAAVFKAMPDAKVTNPERMYDFVRWLAAMEIVDRVPVGVYQAQYSETLRQGQLDSLLDNVLASTIIAFVDKELTDGACWSGTPTELLIELEALCTIGTTRSSGWPSNPIALSKRLIGLQASLLTQGIKVDRDRGKDRKITITQIGGRP